MAQNKSTLGSLASGLDKIHDSWGWFVALGTMSLAIQTAPKAILLRP